jgi:hypothetical protein
MLPEAMFSRRMWEKVPPIKKKCKECCKDVKNEEVVKEKACKECHKDLSHTFYSDKQWWLQDGVRKCIACSTGSQSPSKIGVWTCRATGCNFTDDKRFFRLWREKQKIDKANGWEKCNECFAKYDADTQDRALCAGDVRHHTVVRKATPKDKKK